MNSGDASLVFDTNSSKVNPDPITFVNSTSINLETTYFYIDDYEFNQPTNQSMNINAVSGGTNTFSINSTCFSRENPDITYSLVPSKSYITAANNKDIE